MGFDLVSKAVLITGAANGIGKACAYDMAQRGAKLIITDIDEDKVKAVALDIRNEGGEVVALRHDVTDEDQWAYVIEQCETSYGGLDALINNAGIMLHIPFASCTYEEFRHQQTVNVDSVFLGCKAAYPLLADTANEDTGCSIVNLSSIFGQIAGPMHSAYCASKGAVRMLSKSLAVEFGRMGLNIRVNSVHPGPTDTDLGRGAVEKARQLGLCEDLESGMHDVAASFPLGRWGDAGDVAGVVAFLVSDASKFVTGAELVVDGGYSIV